MKLQPKQEAFAVAVVKNGGDKVKARAEAGYSTRMTKASQGIDADKLYNHARISLRIAELQKIADKVAIEKFSISVEKRLQWLNDVAEAGLSKYVDQHGNERRENLSAVPTAIKVINEMTGIGEEVKKDDSLNINVRVV